MNHRGDSQEAVSNFQLERIGHIYSRAEKAKKARSLHVLLKNQIYWLVTNVAWNNSRYNDIFYMVTIAKYAWHWENFLAGVRRAKKLSTSLYKLSSPSLILKLIALQYHCKVLKRWSSLEWFLPIIKFTSCTSTQLPYKQPVEWSVKWWYSEKRSTRPTCLCLRLWRQPKSLSRFKALPWRQMHYKLQPWLSFSCDSQRYF